MAPHGSFIGWSNTHFNNLHFIISFETNNNATCFKHTVTSYVGDCLTRRLLK